MKTKIGNLEFYMTNEAGKIFDELTKAHGDNLFCLYYLSNKIINTETGEVIKDRYNRISN